MTAPVAHLVGFGRLLRQRGLAVGTNRILMFCRAAAIIGVSDRRSLYWAGRTTLIGRKEDIEAFDRAFAAYFGGPAFEEAVESLLAEAARPRPQKSVRGLVDEPVVSAYEQDPADEAWSGTARLRASTAEVIRKKSFEALTPEERSRSDRLIRSLALHVPTRRSRRYAPGRRGGRFDLRQTVRSSLRTEGEPFERRWRQRRDKPRSLVLLLDVSGSMSAYSRALLQFGHAAMAAGRRVEVFCFGTRLTRVTQILRIKDPDVALTRVSDGVRDWEGGTRIGDSVGRLLDRYASTAALRGAVVVLCSDGLERGDPNVLTARMARLNRLAHRVVWVNPLKGEPRYEPLARGMAAALPYIDVFLPGHNVESLERLTEVLGERS
jgi:uncharacterized protein